VEKTLWSRIHDVWKSKTLGRVNYDLSDGETNRRATLRNHVNPREAREKTGDLGAYKNSEQGRGFGQQNGGWKQGGVYWVTFSSYLGRAN